MRPRLTWFRPLRRTRWWLPAALALAGVAIAVALFITLEERQERVTRTAFKAEARDRVNVLKNRLQRLFEAVHGLAGFYEGSEPVTREEFKAFTAPLLERHRGLKMLFWVPRVPAERREAFEAFAPPGMEDPIRIREQTTEGEFVPAGERSVYFPVYYIQPLEGHEWLRGFDLASREATRKAMVQAREREQVMATQPIVLISGRDAVRSVWVFRAVTRKPLPTEEVGPLEGFVGGAFRTDEVLRGIVPVYGPRDMILRIRDMEAPPGEGLIYASHRNEAPRTEAASEVGAGILVPGAQLPPGEQADNEAEPDPITDDAGPLYTDSVEVAGRRWRILAQPTQRYLQSRENWTPPVLLGSGVGLSLLLGVYLHTALARRDRVEREVDRRTNELRREVDQRRRYAERAREAEAFLESVVENIPHMIAVQDAGTLRFVRLNKAAGELLGYPREALIDKRPAALMSPEETERFERKDREAARHGGSYEVAKHTVHTHHRGLRTFRTKKVPLKEPAGRVKHLLTIAEDITEQERAERALRDSEQRFRSVAETAMDAIVTADADDRITFFNRAAETMFGYSHDEAVGEPLTLLMPERYHEDHLRGFNHYLETREPRLIGRVVELTAQHKDDHEFPVELSLAAHEEDGHVIFTGIMRNISERKEAERRLREAADALKRSNRELEQFAYIASHDLQEPLRKIRGFGDMLRAEAGDALNATARDYLRRMQEAAGRMQALIQGLLNYSRVTTKAQPFERVDLEQIARQVVEDLAIRVRETGGEVRIDSLPEIEADPLQMRQLLQNLIGNGLKFHRKGVPPEVRISGETVGDGSCRIHVRDNGIGFGPREAERLFQPFQRLHSRAEYEGTGMGLAVCKKIAERHGGSITADSTPGEGTVFTAVLPCHPSESEGEASDAA